MFQPLLTLPQVKGFYGYPQFLPAARTPCCSHILSASRLNSAEYLPFPICTVSLTIFLSRVCAFGISVQLYNPYSK